MRRRREKFRVLVFFTVAAAAIMLPSSAPAVEIVINVRIEAANGAVTSSDGTVNCSGACVVRVPYGRVLTLRAAPAPNFLFAGWRGACIGAAPTCKIFAGRITAIRALFRRMPTTVAITVSGPGAVYSAPSRIHCGAAAERDNCEATFGAGTSVTLRAVPAPGGRFVRWTNPCGSVAPTCRLAVGSDSVETAAVFGSISPIPPGGKAQPGERTLTVRVTEALHDERDIVTSTPSGIGCPTTCSAEFEAGAEVTLRGGRAFGGWTGGCHGKGVCIVVLDRDATVSARAAGPITPAPRGLGVSVSVSGRGSVTSRGIQCGGVTGTVYDCQALYYPRTTILLRARPAKGNEFGGWGGFCSGKKLLCPLTVAASMTVTAFFRPRGG